MDLMVLLLVLGLNVLISVWNCYAVGTAWKDTMALGGWFSKLVLWSAVIQSGVGFSMPIMLGLAFGGVAYLTAGVDPMLKPAEGEELLRGILSLWYVAIILPVLGSGFAIWAHSLREAYRRRDFASIAAAGWNSFAQIHNVVSAARDIGGALTDVGKLFDGVGGSDSDSKNKLGLIAALIVVLALIGGFLIAFGLVRHFARTTESRIEEYAAQMRRRQYA